MSHIELKSGEEQLAFRSKNYKLQQKSYYATGLLYFTIILMQIYCFLHYAHIALGFRILIQIPQYPYRKYFQYILTTCAFH